MQKYLVFSLLFLLPFSACKTSSDHDESVVKIVNGIETSDYPAVVALYFTSSIGTGICTGTFIHNEWVLTAAHCIVGHPEPLKVTWAENGKTFEAIEVIAHPDFKRAEPGTAIEPQNSRSDIALIKFAVKNAPAIMPVNRDKDIIEGSVIIMVGYGSDIPKGDFSRTGKKRLGRNIIKLADQGIIGISDLTRQVLKDALPGQISVTAQGDSGGPALDDDGVIIGVTSMGMNIQGATVAFFCDVNNPDAKSFLDKYLK